MKCIGGHVCLKNIWNMYGWVNDDCMTFICTLLVVQTHKRIGHGVVWMTTQLIKYEFANLCVGMNSKN